MGKLFERYHPELHYMRGPGPKWLEKHGTAPSLRRVSWQGSRAGEKWFWLA